VPSIAALNPEIEPELEAIIRKSLARDPNDRYQTANDMGDALTQYLFSRRMKVSARDIASLVKDTQVEMMRKRSSEPKDSLIDALILDEMQKMTSLLGGEGKAEGSTSEGSMSLDPSTFVDTAAWSDEMGLASHTQAPPQKRDGRGTRPPPVGGSKPVTANSRLPPSNEIESLEQMLEPERTGVHNKANGPNWPVIIIVMIVLAAGAAVAVVFAMQ
jgi:serine/threonine-protein kinase